MMANTPSLDDLRYAQTVTGITAAGTEFVSSGKLQGDGAVIGQWCRRSDSEFNRIQSGTERH